MTISPPCRQNYHKREVMALALPVAVKFLHKGNRELSRNMSSYLSLAAIEAADLLALHIQPIIDSVISGQSKVNLTLFCLCCIFFRFKTHCIISFISLLYWLCLHSYIHNFSSFNSITCNLFFFSPI